MNILATTYQTVIPPEPAMSWKSYEAIIKREWSDLFARTDTTERDFQVFFEQHPCCLPDMGRFFPGGGHGAFPGAVVSQPVLHGFAKKVPDFLYIARDSACVYTVLVEIEHPSKSWATAGGQPSAEFTQATNQITDWKSWFSDPLNTAKFKEDYGIPQEWLRSREFSQKYILVYGRRQDPTLTEAFNKKRKHLERTDEVYMTYDRIRPNRDAAQYLCVTRDAAGYRALTVPPTIELGPFLEHGVKTIRDKTQAVANNPYLSTVRKKFLVDRWPYWDSWGGGGICHSADRE
ncbi:Shedu anti-phage system protein SduA domain-containing protein [Oleiharenicola lentus]|uniref:Shedu anti-phage system protein SduA domain-containing protein n=1 Tax=Oleiharenicola lentus TaxID=2508720 RepID=UPI003F67833E